MSDERSAQRAEVITKFRRSEKDTGSSEVQVALLTSRIQRLVKHFEKFPKDHHSRRGMLRMIANRKQLLEYMRDCDPDRYRSTVSSLGLRK